MCVFFRDFLNPILLVTLFLPGDKVSAAAALGALYYFALANQVRSLGDSHDLHLISATTCW